MSKSKRYIFIPVNKSIINYDLYGDIVTKNFFKYQNETYSLNIHDRMALELDDMFTVSNSFYCFIGFITLNDMYWSSKSNELLMFLQQELGIYSSDLDENINFSDVCSFSTFRKNINWLKNSQIKSTNKSSLFKFKNKKNDTNIILDTISSTFNTAIKLNDVSFTKKDFQPIFFNNDRYMKNSYVIQIYKDIENLYNHINDSFNNFIKKSSLKEEYKNIHFLDIEYDLFKHFTKIEDSIIFHDYFGLLNSNSDKFVADFLLSMIKQTDKSELKKIKNYITKKEIKDNMYLFYNILKYYNIQDEIIFEERKTKYLKLINDFRERVSSI